MAVPKRKTSKSKRNKRRTHDALTPPATTSCSQCGEPKAPHRVCMECGYYGGEEIIALEE
ncbi:MAG: 50S ribosomal protein L32 [bacterium]